jgi:uncharacterized protein YgfB (UPF0149 family)
MTISACGAEAQLQQHAEKVRSLRATTIAIADAWLHGNVSGVYAQGALEQTFQLLEQERAAVAGTPDDLARPAANALAHTSEQLSREIAALTRDVRMADGPNARRHLGDLEATTPEQP